MAPKYRQLHTKTIDSFDFNEMPDDFCRVTWLLLPLIVDSAGRGIYNPSWIRSKMYPLRGDVTDQMVLAAFQYFERRGMVKAYEVDGRLFFYIPTFTTYQYGLDKEARSVLPPPIEVQSNSRPTQELGRSSQVDSASASASAYESESESAYASDDDSFQSNPISTAFTQASKITPHTLDRWARSLEKIRKTGATPADVTSAVEELRNKGFNIVGPWSVENAVIIAKGKREHPARKNGQEEPDAWQRAYDIVSHAKE